MFDGSSRYLSPLRYPGGKARLAKFVGGLIAKQKSRPLRYVEPYAGGGGVGLRLLVDEYVDEIVLNDLNPGIAAFWRTVFAEPELLLEMIRTSEVTIDEWHRQRAIYTSGGESDVELGFATFFLNRTNRSGILNARPIGGLEQQGKWKIDARFDRQQLAARIRGLSQYRSRVTICEEDGASVIATHLGDGRSFVYADPPYLEKADDLYLDTFKWEDHVALADLLNGSSEGWMLTYDADARVTDVLYPDRRCAEFQMSHTAAVQHVATEYAVFGEEVTVGALDSLGSGEAKFVA